MRKASLLGARVIHVRQLGYGSALKAGTRAARGSFIVMGDADDTYDFSEVPSFVDMWRRGYDAVMGNRFRGEIKPAAMCTGLSRLKHAFTGHARA